MAALVTNPPAPPAPALPQSVADIRDIAPPVDIPSGLAWVWWGLAVVVVLLVALALWFWRRKQPQQTLRVPTLPAHVRAKMKLLDALQLISQPKPFVIAVSDTTRNYLEERFDFRAPERTTEEFLLDLQKTDRLTRDQKESLSGFLERCDLVKFAKYEPGESELRDLHGSAVRLVEETEPVTAALEAREANSALRTPHSALK